MGAGSRSSLHKIVGPHAENGRRIREARKQRKLSQTLLGDAAGVTYRQIIRYENGEHLPSGDVRDRLADALGLDPALIESADDSQEDAADSDGPFRGGGAGGGAARAGEPSAAQEEKAAGKAAA